jgi:hypothetical protein
MIPQFFGTPNTLVAQISHTLVYAFKGLQSTFEIVPVGFLGQLLEDELDFGLEFRLHNFLALYRKKFQACGHFVSCGDVVA